MGSKLNVFVVGAGVVGLSTAIRALEADFDVTIFAEAFPEDDKSIKYTSCWAAANHVSVATTNALLHQLERETFSLGPDDKTQMDHLSRCYPDFRLLEPGELPQGVAHGGVFSTFCIDVPRYLPYLMKRFLTLGGHAFRVTLPSLSALISEEDRPTLTPFPLTSINGPPSFHPAAIINCTGLGALSLGDVLDTNIYPTRGEVLIIRAPWINHGLSHYYEDGHLSYAIPRQSGDVILGGTFQVDDWHPTCRPETLKLIKERGIAAYPELLPPNKREARNIADLDVIEECVGLRPTRKGGVRLEITSLKVHEKIVPVIHNIGHGGAGYQSSWGSAQVAVDLLKSAVKK
ncbi:hypothetical protein B0H12DRAFT_1202435 [Mycena haematopus]|nr:hypothetical protein B0H12DRAFT_1202435 [Mycena haematopus]